MTSIPSSTWRMLQAVTHGQKLPTGADAVTDRAIGYLKRCYPRTAVLMRQARKVEALATQYKDLADARLKATALELRDLFSCGRDKPEDLTRAFAVVREVATRVRGERPYLVQLAGGLAIARGWVAEMATGEGKTLTATLPATVMGWRGRSCHVVTVNDYLAARDAEWMRPVYTFCGLTCAHVEGKMEHPDRRAAYQADITYTTNKEVAADFLRDRLRLGRSRGSSQLILRTLVTGSGGSAENLLLRGLHYAIVDEADSILIDEAVTPLIISGDAPNQVQSQAFKQAADVARQLLENEHYRVDLRYREVRLTNTGKDKAEELTLEHGGIWHGRRRREELITQALTAREMFHRDQHYIIDEEKVVIVDEFTGRLMPDRTWREGLHQAIEAKEELTVNEPKDTFARVSFQRFFRMYRHLSGMTGTAVEATAEMWQIYHRPVVVIPTNRPCVRQHLPDHVFTSESAKWSAVVEEIKRQHATGRPILVGTRSVSASEKLSALLTAENPPLPHQVLNAVRHKEEAQIVAQAGQPGAITVATNMAGRGTDIKLGRGMADLGGLCVIACERNDSRRVDRQLFGRSGRQGDPGSAQAFVALTDDVLKRYARGSAKMLLAASGGGDHAVPYPRLADQLIRQAQRRANRLALRQRKGVLSTDDWLEEALGFSPE